MQHKDKDILYRPWRELKDLQNRRLKHFITRKLYPFSPYYHRLFDKHKIDPASIKTTQDLKRIPFTSKEDFLLPQEEGAPRKEFDFILQPDEGLIKKHLPKSELIRLAILRLLMGKDYLKKSWETEYRPIFLTATAGTTGRPISFLYTSYDLENLRLYGKRIVEIFDIKRDERIVNLFPYAPHLAFWQSVFTGFSANVFVLSTGGGKTLGTEGNIDTILKVEPKIIIGVPNYIYHLLKTARARGLKMKFLQNIALGASRIPKGFKIKLSKLLFDMGASNIRIQGTYGFTESRCAWVECPTDIDISSGYHTYPDKEVLEIIDPKTGEVKGEGQDGEIVYTSIDGRGTCVLRYRTGDLVRGGLIYSPCPYCKRTTPRLCDDIVRASNIKGMQFSKVKGALVNLNTFEHILNDKEDIDEWQIEITKKDNDPYEVDELNLYLSFVSDVDKEDFARRLNEEVFSLTEVSFNKIDFVSHSDMQKRIEVEFAIKAKSIVDKRPKI